MILGLVVAGAVAFGIFQAVRWPGFRAQTVDIIGAKIVPKAQIGESASIKPTDNIWLLNTSRIAKRIEEIPYILDARVDRFPPNLVRLVVTERTPESCIRTPDRRTYTIDATQRVLDEHCTRSLHYAVNAQKNIAPGHFIADAQLTRLRADATILNDAGMSIAELSFDRDGGLVATRTDGLHVLLGEDGDLPAKTALVSSTIATASQHGRVDMLDLREPNTPTLQYRVVEHIDPKHDARDQHREAPITR